MFLITYRDAYWAITCIVRTTAFKMDNNKNPIKPTTRSQSNGVRDLLKQPPLNIENLPKRTQGWNHKIKILPAKVSTPEQNDLSNWNPPLAKRNTATTNQVACPPSFPWMPPPSNWGFSPFQGMPMCPSYPLPWCPPSMYGAQIPIFGTEHHAHHASTLAAAGNSCFSGKKQSPCCGAGSKVVCVPKGQRPVLPNGNGCQPNVSAPRPNLCDHCLEQPASYNNCNFYVTEGSPSKSTAACRQSPSPPPECCLPADALECMCPKDDCAEMDALRNLPAGDCKIVHPPVGYPGSKRTPWGNNDDLDCSLECTETGVQSDQCETRTRGTEGSWPSTATTGTNTYICCRKTTAMNTMAKEHCDVATHSHDLYDQQHQEAQTRTGNSNEYSDDEGRSHKRYSAMHNRATRHFESPENRTYWSMREGYADKEHAHDHHHEHTQDKHHHKFSILLDDPDHHHEHTQDKQHHKFSILLDDPDHHHHHGHGNKPHHSMSRGKLNGSQYNGETEHAQDRPQHKFSILLDEPDLHHHHDAQGNKQRQRGTTVNGSQYYDDGTTQRQQINGGRARPSRIDISYDRNGKPIVDAMRSESPYSETASYTNPGESRSNRATAYSDSRHPQNFNEMNRNGAANDYPDSGWPQPAGQDNSRVSMFGNRDDVRSSNREEYDRPFSSAIEQRSENSKFQGSHTGQPSTYSNVKGRSAQASPQNGSSFKSIPNGYGQTLKYAEGNDDGMQGGSSLQATNATGGRNEFQPEETGRMHSSRADEKGGSRLIQSTGMDDKHQQEAERLTTGGGYGSSKNGTAINPQLTERGTGKDKGVQMPYSSDKSTYANDADEVQRYEPPEEELYQRKTGQTPNTKMSYRDDPRNKSDRSTYASDPAGPQQRPNQGRDQDFIRGTDYRRTGEQDLWDKNNINDGVTSVPPSGLIRSESERRQLDKGAGEAVYSSQDERRSPKQDSVLNFGEELSNRQPKDWERDRSQMSKQSPEQRLEKREQRRPQGTYNPYDGTLQTKENGGYNDRNMMGPGEAVGYKDQPHGKINDTYQQHLRSSDGAKDRQKGEQRRPQETYNPYDGTLQTKENGRYNDRNMMGPGEAVGYKDQPHGKINDTYQQHLRSSDGAKDRQGQSGTKGEDHNRGLRLTVEEEGSAINLTLEREGSSGSSSSSASSYHSIQSDASHGPSKGGAGSETSLQSRQQQASYQSLQSGTSQGQPSGRKDSDMTEESESYQSLTSGTSQGRPSGGKDSDITQQTRQPQGRYQSRQSGTSQGRPSGGKDSDITQQTRHPQGSYQSRQSGTSQGRPSGGKDSDIAQQTRQPQGSYQSRQNGASQGRPSGGKDSDIVQQTRQPQGSYQSRQNGTSRGRPFGREERDTTQQSREPQESYESLQSGTSQGLRVGREGSNVIERFPQAQDFTRGGGSEHSVRSYQSEDRLPSPYSSQATSYKSLNKALSTQKTAKSNTGQGGYGVPKNIATKHKDNNSRPKSWSNRNVAQNLSSAKGEHRAQPKSKNQERGGNLNNASTRRDHREPQANNQVLGQPKSLRTLGLGGNSWPTVKEDSSRNTSYNRNATATETGDATPWLGDSEDRKREHDWAQARADACFNYKKWPQQMLCRPKRPAACLKVHKMHPLAKPKCPVRETFASILRKQPPATCKYHDRSLAPFIDYCDTSEANPNCDEGGVADLMKEINYNQWHPQPPDQQRKSKSSKSRKRN